MRYQYKHLKTIVEARNVVNTDEIDKFLSQFSPEREEVKTWVKRNLRNHLINEAEGRPYGRAPSSDSPEWLKKAYESGAELFEVILNNDLRGKIEHIIHFLDARGPERLSKMSFKDAERGAEAWLKSTKTEKNIKKQKDVEGDIEKLADLSDGHAAYQLKTKDAIVREGTKHAVCLKDPNMGYHRQVEEGRLFLVSIRKPEGRVSAILAITPEGRILEMKGYANGPVESEDRKYIHEFLKKMSA